MILRKNNVPNEEVYINSIQERNNELLHHLIQNNFTLPPVPPIEIHPYLEDFDLGAYDKYIIGTFPPINYLNDNQILLNAGLDLLHKPNGAILNTAVVPFFHGNNANVSLWQYLLDEDVFNHVFNVIDRLEARAFLMEYLNEKNINYSDIIYSTKRSIYSHQDSCLENIVKNDILIKHIFNNNVNINRLLFNTSNTFSTNGLSIHTNNVANGVAGQINVNNDVKSFDLFFRYLQDLDCKIEFGIENEYFEIDWIELNFANANLIEDTLRAKILFKARVTIVDGNDFFINDNKIIKEFYVITPFSPAARGNVNLNPIILNWRLQNQNQNRNVLLKLIYQSFIRFNEEDVTFLKALNHFYH